MLGAKEGAGERGLEERSWVSNTWAARGHGHWRVGREEVTGVSFTALVMGGDYHVSSFAITFRSQSYWRISGNLASISVVEMSRP